MDKVDIKNITPDANQPRKYFNSEKMFTLKESIKSHGIMSPLIVQEIGAGKYLLIDGERRYRAASDLGLKQVPVIIEKPSTESERLIRQFNIQEQHEAWTYVEKAQAIIALSQELGMSLKDTCKVLGVSSRQESSYIAFSGLADKDAFVKGEMPIEHAVALRALKAEVVNIYRNRLEKEFTLSDEKKLEKRYITSVKNGEILKNSDATRLKDAFQKNPKLIEKYLNSATATPTGLFLEAKAKGANALRNLMYDVRYVAAHGRTFLEQPDVKITTEQLSHMVTAQSILKKIIDMA